MIHANFPRFRHILLSEFFGIFSTFIKKKFYKFNSEKRGEKAKKFRGKQKMLNEKKVTEMLDNSREKSFGSFMTSRNTLHNHRR